MKRSVFVTTCINLLIVFILRNSEGQVSRGEADAAVEEIYNRLREKVEELYG